MPECMKMNCSYKMSLRLYNFDLEIKADFFIEYS